MHFHVCCKQPSNESFYNVLCIYSTPLYSCDLHLESLVKPETKTRCIEFGTADVYGIFIFHVGYTLQAYVSFIWSTWFCRFTLNTNWVYTILPLHTQTNHEAHNSSWELYIYNKVCHKFYDHLVILFLGWKNVLWILQNYIWKETKEKSCCVSAYNASKILYNELLL